MPDDLFQQVLDAARALGVTEIGAIVSQDAQALVPDAAIGGADPHKR